MLSLSLSRWPRETPAPARPEPRRRVTKKEGDGRSGSQEARPASLSGGLEPGSGARPARGPALPGAVLPGSPAGPVLRAAGPGKRGARLPDLVSRNQSGG